MICRLAARATPPPGRRTSAIGLIRACPRTSGGPSLSCPAPLADCQEISLDIHRSITMCAYEWREGPPPNRRIDRCRRCGYRSVQRSQDWSATQRFVVRVLARRRRGRGEGLACNPPGFFWQPPNDGVPGDAVTKTRHHEGWRIRVRGRASGRGGVAKQRQRLVSTRCSAALGIPTRPGCRASRTARGEDLPRVPHQRDSGDVPIPRAARLVPPGRHDAGHHWRE
jgi:hypothetical protein